MKNWRSVLVALYGLGMAVSISLGEGAGYALLAISVIGLAFGVRPTSVGRSPLEPPVAAFFLWGLIATRLAHADSFLGSVQAQTSMLLFILSLRCFSADENRRWLRWLCIGAVVSGVVAAVQAASGINHIPTSDQYIVPAALERLPHKMVSLLSLRDGRAVSTRNHPLTFGETVLIALFFLVAAPLRKPAGSAKRRFFEIGLVLVGIVLSFARGVWLGTLAGFVVLAVVWRRQRAVRVWIVGGLVMAVLAIGLVPKIRTRALSIVTAKTGVENDQGSRSTRFLLWEAARPLIAERPMTGHGLRGFFMTITEPGSAGPRVWSEAHDIYIQIVGERGFIGLGLFFWILFVFLRSSLASEAGWREAGLAFLAAILVAGITESWVHDGEIDMLFWAVIGAVERVRLERASLERDA